MSFVGCEEKGFKKILTPLLMSVNEYMYFLRAAIQEQEER
jgi:hypothetical protein